MKKRSSLMKVLLFPLFTTFIVAVFLLTFSVNIKAASYFPIYQNENELIPDSVYNYVLNNYGEYFFIRFASEDSNYKNYYYVSFYASSGVPKGSINSNGYQFSLVNSNVKNNGRIRLNKANGQLSRDSTNGGFNSAFVNMVSSSYSSNTCYRSNFELYTSNNDGILLIFVPITVPTQGHSHGYMNNIPQFSYPIGMHPTSAPTVPTYQSPSLTTAPTIDTTNINTLVQSIFSLLSWILQSILAYLGSIIQVLIDWFTFISNLAIWIADFIKQCFLALMDFLYNNFSSLFEPFFNFLSGIFKFLFNEDDQLSVYDLIKSFKDSTVAWLSNFWSNSFIVQFWNNLKDTYSELQNVFGAVLIIFEKLKLLGTVNGEFSIANLINALFVPDTAQVTAALMGHDDFHFYDTSHAIVQKVDYIKTTLSTVTPEKRFYVPSTTYHGVNIGGFYIDFSWYDDYKLYGDLLISTFLTIGFVYWVCLNMSNFIRGQSSVGNDVHRLEK